MSGIFGGKKPKMAGFRVPTSVYGLPVPIVYGRARLAGNVLQMPTLPVPVHTKGSSKMGKGAGDQIFIGPIAIALCEGPIVGIGNVWADKDAAVDYATVYTPAGWNLKTGTSSQTSWTTPTAGERVPYQFTAYVYHDANVFPNNSLHALSWEIKGFYQFGVGPIIDADLADVLGDYLTNAQYGANFPSARIASLTTFFQYSAAAGLFGSFVFDSRQPAREQLNELFEIGNTAAVWSDGQLKAIPYGDVALTANGQTYTPNTTPLYDLTDTDYLPREGDLDPVLVVRKDASTAVNRVEVEYESRLFNYNAVTEKAEDQASLETYGPTAISLTLHAIKVASVAQQVAQLRLQREQNVRNKYKFKLGWKYSLLEPMDLVTLTDSALGLAQTPVRLIDVTELDDEQGIECTAEDWPFGTASATLYATGIAGGISPNVNVAPGNTTAPYIFEGPVAIQSAPLEIWVAASGGTYWGGCEIWISTDDTEYQKLGVMFGKSSYGVLSANASSSAFVWPTVDAVNTIKVDLTTSGGSLASLSLSDFQSLRTICKIIGSNKEWISFLDATLTSAYHYDLTNLYRGVYGSIVNTHSTNDPFIYCDDQVGKFPWPTAKEGDTVYLKFLSFNIYGGALQSLGDVSSTTFTFLRDAVSYQNAPAQGTVSIDTNGNWSEEWDGGSRAASYKYSTSTSAFPSDATVIASGTSYNGRQGSIVSGGTLTFGQTIYTTIVPYTGPNGTGSTLPSIRLRGSYQTFTATKTVYFGAFRLTLPDQGTYPPFTTVNGYVTQQGTNNAQVRCIDNLQIPSGVTITEIAADLYSGSYGFGVGSTAYFEIFRTDSTGGQTSLGNNSSHEHGGWETKTISLSESTTGRRYKLFLFLENPTIPQTYDTERYAGCYVTYTMPAPDIAL